MAEEDAPGSEYFVDDDVRLKVVVSHLHAVARQLDESANRRQEVVPMLAPLVDAVTERDGTVKDAILDMLDVLKTYVADHVPD